jgi:hypothetical protein
MRRKFLALVAIMGVTVAANAATVSNAQAADKMYLRYSQWLPAGWWGQSKLLYPWFK